SIRTTLAARHEAHPEVLPLRLEDHPARDRDAGPHALPVSAPRRALRRRGQAGRQKAQGPRMSANETLDLDVDAMERAIESLSPACASGMPRSRGCATC